MTFQQFMMKYNGKYVEMGGSADAKNQCVDLANAYIKEVLGLPIILWTNAQDFPSKAGSKYTWIKNTPDALPKYGDIMIWNMGSYGHIAMFISGNLSKFTSFDQNYPKGTPAHAQGHTYSNVIGWLRPKGENMATIAELEKQLAEVTRENKINYAERLAWVRIARAAQAELAELKLDDIEDEKTKVALQNTINELNKKLSEQPTEEESAINWLVSLIKKIKEKL